MGDINWKSDRKKTQGSGDTCLHAAVTMHKYDTVVMLVDNYNASTTVKNDHGATPLDLARRMTETNPEILEFLAEHQEDEDIDRLKDLKRQQLQVGDQAGA